MVDVTRRTMNALFVAAYLLIATQEPLPAATEWSRLRITDNRTAGLVRLGVEQSAILRALIAEVEGGDVMVYVDSDPGLPGRQAGRMILLGEAGGRRYVHVAIRRTLLGPQFIAALAHEMQHVREVIAHPDVRDGVTLTRLYRRIGDERKVRGNTAWETDAARRVTHDVRRELLSRRAGKLATSSQ